MICNLLCLCNSMTKSENINEKKPTAKIADKQTNDETKNFPFHRVREREARIRYMWNTFHWIDRLTDWLTDLLVLNWLSDSEWNRVRYDLALFGGSGLPARAVCVFVVCAVQLAFWPLTVYGVNARCVCMWLAGYTTSILLSVYGVNRKQKQQRPSRRPRELCVCVAHTRRKWKALCSMTRCVSGVQSIDAFDFYIQNALRIIWMERALGAHTRDARSMCGKVACECTIRYTIYIASAWKSTNKQTLNK